MERDDVVVVEEVVVVDDTPALEPEPSRGFPVLPVVLGAAALSLAGFTLARRLRKSDGETSNRVERTITVDRSPSDVYGVWRDFSRLPRFMTNLERVDVSSPTESTWVARGPAGSDVSWHTRITEDRPSQAIAWQTTDRGAGGVAVDGRVDFSPADGEHRTTVRVGLTYDTALGTAGTVVAKLLGVDPAQQVDEDLKRFKELVEGGTAASGNGAHY